MARLHQLLFIIALNGLCWLLMMAVHELGHVVGALTTGGKVTQLVLHPLAISRTDVAPNPHPAVVVWLGPLVGCLVPLMLMVVIPRRTSLALGLLQFFAGYCLVANGAYIALGIPGRIGDCGEMLSTGTPAWVMVLFGAVTVPAGLLLWHRLGSLQAFWRQPDCVPQTVVYWTLGVFCLIVILEVIWAS